MFIHCAFTFFVFHVCLCQTTLSFVKLSKLANSGSCVHWFDFFHPGKNFVHGSLLRKDMERKWIDDIGQKSEFLMFLIRTFQTNHFFCLVYVVHHAKSACACCSQTWTLCRAYQVLDAFRLSGKKHLWVSTANHLFPKRFLQSSLLGRTLDDNNDRVLLDGHHLCFTPC